MPSKNPGIGSEDTGIKPETLPAPSYLSVKNENNNSEAFRKFGVAEPLVANDGGPGGGYIVSLETLPIHCGGTSADNAQEAINNFLGITKGALLYCDGKNWVSLIGKEGQSLAIVNGLPVFTNTSVPIASTASVVTLEDESKAIPNSKQLTAGDGIEINKGTISVDSTVVRQAALQLIQQAFNAFRGHVVLLEDDQVIQGNKLFNELALNDKEIMADGQIYIFPPMADNLVGEETIQTLTNKTLVNPIIESGCQITLKNPTGNYTLKTVMPTAGRIYSFYDANADGDIAIKVGKAQQGCIAYGDGNVIKFTEEGSEGEVLISHTHKPPSFGVISEGAGGTGQRGYAPGDILFAGPGGKLQKLPVGERGQTMKVGSNGFPNWE